MATWPALHRLVRQKWIFWGLNSWPSACEADVIPLHQEPDSYVFEASFLIPIGRWVDTMYAVPVSIDPSPASCLFSALSQLSPAPSLAYLRAAHLRAVPLHSNVSRIASNTNQTTACLQAPRIEILPDHQPDAPRLHINRDARLME